jgi:putative membrane protein
MGERIAAAAGLPWSSVRRVSHSPSRRPTSKGATHVIHYPHPPDRGVLVHKSAIGLTVAACEPRKEQPPADAAADAPSAETSQAPAITDPQIAHIVVTANSSASAMGELAKTKARSSAVKAFAQTMITDYGAVNQQAVKLAQRLKVTPEANDVSRQLQQGADEARTGLESKSGAAFDRAYMEREVQYHQAVLDALDKTLIPGAQNAELKALLQGARPAFAAHLERAKQIQGTLGTA